MQQFLFKKGCQNRQLNSILIHTVTPDKYYKISIISLTQMIESHFGKQFQSKDILVCYQHIVDKFLFDKTSKY